MLGPLQIVAPERGLQRLEWSDAAPVGPRSIVAAAQEQLAEYFAGRLRVFDLPLDPVGTDFQCRAWLALVEIPYGETRTYGEQARRVHRQADRLRRRPRAQGATAPPRGCAPDHGVGRSLYPTPHTLTTQPGKPAAASLQRTREACDSSVRVGT